MSKLELINGSCVNQKVDVVVNAANRNLISGGGICGVIFKKTGYLELNNSCRRVETPLKDGQAVITPSFNMTNCNYIIHAVGPDFRKNPYAYKELFNAYYNSLVLLKDNNLNSISFPLISSGIFGVGLDKPAKISTEQCFKAFNKFVSVYKDNEISVKLCAFTKKEYEDAKSVFDNIK